jgi:hypothetical protein
MKAKTKTKLTKQDKQFIATLYSLVIAVELSAFIISNLLK